MRDGVRSAIAALTFLTAIPVARRATIADRDLRRGLALFPLIGAIVGASVALVAWGASLILPPLPAAALAVTAGALLTGALHLDGLADTADGVGAALAGRDPAAVMDDPRVGTFGAAAIVMDLVLRVSVLAGLVPSDRFPWEVVAAAALGRTAVLGLLLLVPYAGPDGGVGSWTRPLGRLRCLAGLAAGVAIGLLAAGIRFVPMVVVAVLVGIVTARWSTRHLGGVRGDTLGASVELVETMGLTVALATS